MSDTSSRRAALTVGRGASHRIRKHSQRAPDASGLRASHRGACPLATRAAPDAQGFAAWERGQDETGHVHSERQPGHYADADEMLRWLALHTGDEDFQELVLHALLMDRKWGRWQAGIVRVSQPVVGYDIVEGKVEPRLGEATIERWSARDDDARAHNWRRVLMYLAGHKRAASMTRLGIEGGAVLHAYIRPATAHDEPDAWLPGWSSLVPPRARPLEREETTSIRGRSFSRYLANVERCRDGVWSEVWWTAPGDRRRHGYSRERLATGARARRGTVRRQLLADDRAARAWAAPRARAAPSGRRCRVRMRLDDYAAHVVAYLLLEGFGSLPPHPPGEAAAAFAGCHTHDPAIAIHKHRDAARILIAGWETVGSE